MRRDQDAADIMNKTIGGIPKRILFDLPEDDQMSVAQPQKEGISAVKLNEDYWKPHTGQLGPAPAGNPMADNNNPGEFTGAQPGAGESMSNYAPGRSTTPGKQAWQK